MEEYILKKEFITLGQVLKELDVISSGGRAKIFLAEEEVFVNGELENRRGRKLYDGSLVEVQGQQCKIRLATPKEQAEFEEELAEKRRVEEMIRKINQKNKSKRKKINPTKQKMKRKAPPRVPGVK